MRLPANRRGPDPPAVEPSSVAGAGPPCPRRGVGGGCRPPRLACSSRRQSRDPASGRLVVPVVRPCCATRRAGCRASAGRVLGCWRRVPLAGRQTHNMGAVPEIYVYVGRPPRRGRQTMVISGAPRTATHQCPGHPGGSRRTRCPATARSRCRTRSQQGPRRAALRVTPRSPGHGNPQPSRRPTMRVTRAPRASPACAAIADTESRRARTSGWMFRVSVRQTVLVVPDIATLRRRSQSLAMLAAMMSPEWESRYFSFASRRAPGEEMASMRNGSGDDPLPQRAGKFLHERRVGWSVLEVLAGQFGYLLDQGDAAVHRRVVVGEDGYRDVHVVRDYSADRVHRP